MAICASNDSLKPTSPTPTKHTNSNCGKTISVTAKNKQQSEQLHHPSSDDHLGQATAWLLSLCPPGSVACCGRLRLSRSQVNAHMLRVLSSCHASGMRLTAPDPPRFREASLASEPGAP